LPGIRLLAVLLLVLSLTMMFYTGLSTTGYQDLFLAAPMVDATVAIEKAEQMNLYLTYETASTHRDTTLLSVSHAYGRVLGYSMLSGSFFTANAQEERQKCVVLNESLARDAFGGFDIVGLTYKINGEPYLVTGVVDDKQERKNAYIPAQNTAASFLAVMETEEQTIADLRSLGVNANRFHLVNLSEVAQTVSNKPWLALIGLGILILLVLFYATIKTLIALYQVLERKYREEYLGELLQSQECRKFAGLTLAVIVESLAFLWLILKAAVLLLHWAKYAGNLQGVTSQAFGGIAQDLQSLCLISSIALGIYCGGALLGLIGIKRDQQSL